MSCCQVCHLPHVMLSGLLFATCHVIRSAICLMLSGLLFAKCYVVRSAICHMLCCQVCHLPHVIRSAIRHMLVVRSAICHMSCYQVCHLPYVIRSAIRHMLCCQVCAGSTELCAQVSVRVWAPAHLPPVCTGEESGLLRWDNMLQSGQRVCQPLPDSWLVVLCWLCSRMCCVVKLTNWYLFDNFIFSPNDYYVRTNNALLKSVSHPYIDFCRFLSWEKSSNFISFKKKDYVLAWSLITYDMF